MNSKAMSPIAAALIVIVVLTAMIILYSYSVAVIGTTSKTITESSSGLSLSATGEVVTINPESNQIFLRNGNPDIIALIQAVFKNGEKTDCTDVRLSSTGTVELNSTNCPGLVIEDTSTYVITGTNNLRITGRI
ncbi:MAG: hypothetical protein GOV15_02805 [Candidatus Diapherotrites archaeon]|nr:hypothetical protein [Candidatus Diapherotrites archaeon]